MTLSDLKARFYAELASVYTAEELPLIFQQVVAFYTRADAKLLLVKNPTVEVDAPLVVALPDVIDKLKQGMPIQYVLGECEFYGHRFLVNSHTLIPRPETEELVQLILQHANPALPLRILDIGTGSGCIAISLKLHLPNAEVTALDVSLPALEIAQDNAKLHAVEVHFEHADILTPSAQQQPFDIIVSNPPYVCLSEQQQMQQNVLAFEPHTALFVDDKTPLLFYEAIARFAKQHLKPEGKLYVEINERFGAATCRLFAEHHLRDIALHKDLFGKDRFVSAVR